MTVKTNTEEYPADHPIHRLAMHVNDGSNGQFKPKLSFEDRCAMLALIRFGMQPADVAAIFGVHRRTAGAISYPDHRAYQNVRDEEQRLGPAEFKKKYITENVLARVEANKPKKVDPGTAARPAASSHAGLHVVKTENTTFSHRVEVVWDETGWGWRDLDGEFPDFITKEGDGFATSRLAFDDAKANIMDMGK